MKIKNFKGSFTIAQSLYNGEDMYVAINYESKNEKTGNVYQLQFIPVNMFTDNGFDKTTDDAVCPDTCIFKLKEICYVILGLAPSAVVKSIKAGNYQEKINYQMLAKKPLRIGAYGDCTSLPYEFIEKIVKASKRGWLNYTHGWQNCDERFANIAMASCETIADKQLANAKGYRTFRVRPVDGEILADEILCPNEKNNFITCEMCMKCNGTWGKSKKNIVVTIHGASHKVKKYNDIEQTQYNHFTLNPA